MPRGPRLDAPGILHHVMVRGIEQRTIFRDDRDRANFVARLGALAEAGAWQVFAWALLPNHAHLLLRTGSRPLARSMRSLLTGYAGAFNRRHKRVGHLFQNRYKSIVVEEEPYFLELVRYLHLNPVRAAVLANLRALERYPWTGHSALLGSVHRPWQATAEVLRRFASRPAEARRRYRAFVAEGAGQGRRPELQGGGLVRSLGGWAAVQILRRGREHYGGDERVLGSSEFVERLREEVTAEQQSSSPGLPLEGLMPMICQHLGIDPAMLSGGSRSSAVCRAREGIAYIWKEAWGRSGRQLAVALGVGPQAVYKAAERGRQRRAEWDQLLSKHRRR